MSVLNYFCLIHSRRKYQEIIIFTLPLEVEKQKLSLRSYLEINPCWGIPNIESCISIGKHVRSRLNFQPKYLQL